MPSFLLKNFLRDSGIEYRIQVDVHKVVKILKVLAGHGIAGFVRVSKGVQKRLEGPFQKLHKGLFHGVFPGAAKNGMLQDMGHSGGIKGGCSKGDAENLVFVISDHAQDLGPGFSVAVQTGFGFQFCYFPFFDQFKWVQRFHGLLRSMQQGFCGVLF